MQKRHLKYDIPVERYISTLTNRQRKIIRSILQNNQYSQDKDICYTYSYDESPVFPVLPAIVVWPESTKDVQQILSFANNEKIPITPRGGGTSKVGGAVPIYGGIVLSMERMNKIITIDSKKKKASLQAGVVTKTLQEYALEKKMLYPVDPNSFDICTIGGNIATNASGPSSMKYGSTSKYVMGLSVVKASGEVIELGCDTSKSSTGYDLKSIISGSEGTLAVITEATMKLESVFDDKVSITFCVLFKEMSSAISSIALLREKGLSLILAEYFDEATLSVSLNEIPYVEGYSVCVVFELESNVFLHNRDIEKFHDIVSVFDSYIILLDDFNKRRLVMNARHKLSSRIKENYRFYVSHDVTVPFFHLIEIFKTIEDLQSKCYGNIKIASYGHAGDGNLHINLLYNDVALNEEVENLSVRIFEQAISLGGTLSGEHGIGLTKKKFLCMEQNASLIQIQKDIKNIWDPKNILNCGKIFP